MPILSFKNRISLYNLLGVSVLILIIFTSIYITVSITVNYDINQELRREVNVHREKVSKINGEIKLVHKEEWMESEHNTIFMNPVFIQIYNSNWESVDKSPNLQTRNLNLKTEKSDEQFIDTYLDTIPIRQIQIQLKVDDQVVGYTVVAMSVQSQYRVLNSLLYILSLTYILFLVILFFLTRFIAGRSIRPALSIMKTTKNITAYNLKDRIILPSNKDELYTLSENINELLDRIEGAVLREKQFTSDASHELRTPLAIIQTTLELLTRKPRTDDEYINKINSCIEEVIRINKLVSQLLMLARFENLDKNFKLHPININDLINEIISRNQLRITEKEIQINLISEKDFMVLSEDSMLSTLLENLISNSIKYSNNNGLIAIKLTHIQNIIICEIKDNGIGILTKDIDKVYDQFYRSEASNHQHIKGSGLGLSIVKKIANVLDIEIEISSIKEKGTTVILKIAQFQGKSY